MTILTPPGDLLDTLAREQSEQTVGNRNTELYRRAKVALEHDYEPTVIREALTPAGIAGGLDADEVKGTLRSALAAEDKVRVPEGTPPIPASEWAATWERTWPRVFGARWGKPDANGKRGKKPNQTWQKPWDQPNDTTVFGEFYGLVLPPGTLLLDVDNPTEFGDSGLPTSKDAPMTISVSGRGAHQFYRLHPDRPYPKATTKVYPGADTKVGGTGISYERSLADIERLPHPSTWPLAPDWLQPKATAPEPLPDIDALSAPLDWPEEPAEEAMHGLVGELVRCIAPHTEASDVGILTSILAIGSALFRGHVFEHGDRQTTNLYVVNVGQSGLGRKSHAQSVAMRLYDLALNGSDWRCLLLPGLESGQALPRIMSDRWAAGAGDPRALLLEGELGRMLAGMGRDGATLSATLRVAWDGLPLGRSVVNRSESAIAAVHHIALLGAITDRELRSKLTDEEQANGFGNRVMWVAVRSPRVVVFPKPLHDMVPQGLLDRLSANLTAAEYGRTHEWSSEAADLWREWYTDWRTTQSATLSSTLVARAPAQVIRLAMTYALLDGAGARLRDFARVSLSVEHLRAALALWAYSERSVKYIFGDSTGDPVADSLLRAIPEVGNAITHSDARSEVAGNRTPALDGAIETLTRLGKVHMTSTIHPRGGRPLRSIVRVRLDRASKPPVLPLSKRSKVRKVRNPRRSP